MHDTSTILRRNVITEDNAESLALHLNELIASFLTLEHLLWVSSRIVVNELRCKFTCLLHWLHPRHELFGMQTLKLCTHHMPYDTIRNILVATLESRQFASISYLAFWFQIGSYTAGSHYQGYFLRIVRVVSLDDNIFNLWSDAQRNIRW